VKTVKSEKMKFERTVPLYSDEIGQVSKEVIGERGKPGFPRRGETPRQRSAVDRVASCTSGRETASP